MYREDFAILILSHGRASNIRTVQALENSGYTGKYYIIIDNEDKTSEEYYDIYKDKVIMFDKQKISDDERFDKFDRFDNKKVIFFARNASMDIAKELGLKYYMQFDDDYTNFSIRYEDKEEFKLRGQTIHNSFDRVIDAMIEFMENTGCLTLCMCQGGDHLGGIKCMNKWGAGLLRKAMNSFLIKVDNDFKFVGRINEDVNTYTLKGNQGELLFTTVDVQLNQPQTQSNSGGMTEQYLDSGTYVKSFYSVICSPQAVKLWLMGSKHKRIHHHVDWNYCTPKIINEKYKKG